ncbi:MAG: carbamoyltransferase, partial [Bryobacterales bacterium]|nr:carbamoyltransferase [Bryobacterales bacterium]
MNILGIGGILHDAAAAVICDGQLVSAIEQRKLTRVEQPGSLPVAAIEECLRIAGIGPQAVDVVSVARPWMTGSEERIHLELRERFPSARMLVVDHQLAHAASAYFASPFEKATVLTMDRLGDFRCGARWRGQGNQLSVDRELYYPDSLGDVFGRLTRLLGFQPHADEHKVQWLSSYGEPRYVDAFRRLLGGLDPSGAGDAWPLVQREMLDTQRAGGSFHPRFLEEVGVTAGALSEQQSRDLAASMQLALSEAVLAMAGDARYVCLAGGVAFNVLLVEALERSGRFDGVFVQPAAGNSGTALGAALHGWHTLNPQAHRVPFHTLCLGPEFPNEAIKQVLENCKLNFRYLLTTENLIQAAIQELNDCKIVAWMQGRMEFGPRALGNRSILASPLNPYSSENLNVYIKHREPFRKFAASVPAEDASEYFQVGENARFLATAGRVRPQYRQQFEHAILGEDIARVHTVTAGDNPL